MYWKNLVIWKEKSKIQITNNNLDYVYKSILSYCLKFRKNVESKNRKGVKTKNRRAMLLSKCSVCNSKKSKFLKEQEARGLLSNLLGVKVPILSDIPKVMQ